MHQISKHNVLVATVTAQMASNITHTPTALAVIIANGDYLTVSVIRACMIHHDDNSVTIHTSTTMLPFSAAATAAAAAAWMLRPADVNDRYHKHLLCDSETSCLHADGL